MSERTTGRQFLPDTLYPMAAQRETPCGDGVRLRGPDRSSADFCQRNDELLRKSSFAAIALGLPCIASEMDQMLNIPKGLKRKGSVMLPILLGMTALLYVLVLMPVRDAQEPAAAPETKTGSD